MNMNTNSLPTTETCRSCGHSIPAELGEACELCLPVEEATKIVWLSRHDLNADQVGDLLRGKAGEIEKVDMTWPSGEATIHVELARLGSRQRREGCLIAAVLPAQVWAHLWRHKGAWMYPEIHVPISEPFTAPDGSVRPHQHCRWEVIG